MIQDTVKEILLAEEEASKMTAQAVEDGKISVQKASEEAEKIKKDIVARVKEDSKKSTDNAYWEGEKQYNLIIASGKKNMTKITDADKQKNAVEFIAKKVIEEYVHC